MSRNKASVAVAISAVVVIFTIYFFISNEVEVPDLIGVSEYSEVDESSESIGSEGTAYALKAFGLKTNTAKTLIDLDLLLSGGPGKDGIPAINNPKFDVINEVNMDNDVLGILVDINGDIRYYPYNILVWHEITNDVVGGKDVAVTFCPLCGSAIVFDRVVGGKTLNFGVSGLLYESNLVMYDTETESLWSQAEGRSIVGDLAGTDLNLVQMQLISFEELKKQYPQAKVLSTNTGYARNYKFYPYGGYDSSDEIYFPISNSDKRLPPKEIMFAFTVSGTPVAFEANKLTDGLIKKFKVGNTAVTAERNGEEILVRDGSKIIPGYFIMWFSWATHNGEKGILWELN